MHFLFKRVNERTEAWWHNVELDSGRPQIIRELPADVRSVVADPAEIDEALRWARDVPGWSDQTPPVYVRDASTEGED
jgi:hypothetical protein